MKNYLAVACLLCTLLMPFASMASKTSEPKSNPHTVENMKSRFYLYWGWNRARYSKSDLHMIGKNYDYTLEQIQAKDRQTPFSFRHYLYFTQISVPQTNLKLGYYINNHYSVAVGFDHMKYVMVQNQMVKIYGRIDAPDTDYDGIYDGQTIELKKDFLRYEHTNGLNFVLLEINRHDRFIKKSKFQMESVVGFSPGLLRPRSDVSVLNTKAANVFHNAGYGVCTKVGLQALLFNRFTICTEAKAGYINLPDVKTTLIPGEKAEQHFTFLQANVQIGFTFGVK
ncbi:MAG: hypothetical protein GC181_05110 [Bacteroidetes bacterium]|nr:hypothetical protein [Bacteroidota bacterium]